MSSTLVCSINIRITIKLQNDTELDRLLEQGGRKQSKIIHRKLLLQKDDASTSALSHWLITLLALQTWHAQHVDRTIV